MRLIEVNNYLIPVDNILYMRQYRANASHYVLVILWKGGPDQNEIYVTYDSEEKLKEAWRVVKNWLTGTTVFASMVLEL